MGRIIPIDQVERRSTQGRELLVNRYLPRFKKSQLIAYTLWFLLGTVGAHRFYLKQWKVGLAIVLFWLLVPLSTLFLVSKFNTDNSELLLLVPEIFRYLLLGFILVEGAFLFSMVTRYNSELLMRLKTEANLHD